ncbi:MAG: hypothetical protein U9N49_02065 [Campylobacterota bacterium]|nr:hypothetical protein [Campylobacterota bacterium]
MIEWLGRIYLLKLFLLISFIMFVVVMFIANPMIDGKDGLDVVNIQLTFDKDSAQEIVESWGAEGIERFNHLIFSDYLYALSYAFLFASLLLWLLLKTEKQNDIRYSWSIYLGFVAGACDWIENTMELLFINNMESFSNILFILHSMVATLKWLALPIVLSYLTVLLYHYRKLKHNLGSLKIVSKRVS